MIPNNRISSQADAPRLLLTASYSAAVTPASLEPESDATWMSCLCVSHFYRTMLTSQYLLSVFATCLFRWCAYCFTRLLHRSRTILTARSLLTALFGSFRASHLSRTILTSILANFLGYFPSFGVQILSYFAIFGFHMIIFLSW